MKQVLTLPDNRKTNLLAMLKTIHPSASQCSWRRWHKILGTLRITFPAIEGTAGMFTRLQHALKTAKGHRINLSTPVHKELTILRHMVASLVARQTHLQEIRPQPPTWIGATDASLVGISRVCHSPSGEWHIWRLTFSTAIKANILTDDNPHGFLTINNLELAAYIAHLHLFAPRMAPLDHITTGIDNTGAESWARRGSVSTATAIGPLLREAAWITRQSKSMRPLIASQ